MTLSACLRFVSTMALLVSSATAQLQFIEARKRHLPPDPPGWGTFAVAVLDVDGDGDQDLVSGNAGQDRLALNNGNGTFTDATAARMPAESYWTAAVAVADVDGDGDQDLVFGNSGQNRLYLNDGTGTFTDATAARMPARSDSTEAVAVADVDGDGDPDLVLGNYGQRNRLYLNDGTGTFTDATAARMPAGSYLTAAVAVADVDGDGDQDLVFGNGLPSVSPFVGGQNRLYLNDGAGTFTDATAARMPVDNDWTYAVAVSDVDGDGDADLIFGNADFVVSREQNRLYLNDGTGTFTDATAARMPAGSYWTAAVAVADADGDGDQDLVFGNAPTYPPIPPEGQNRLYLNDGTGTFTDVTAARMPADNDFTNAVG